MILNTMMVLNTQVLIHVYIYSFIFLRINILTLNKYIY